MKEDYYEERKRRSELHHERNLAQKRLKSKKEFEKNGKARAFCF
jgi:hypothetical protein